MLCRIIVSERESCFLTKTGYIAIHIIEFSFIFYFLLTDCENLGEGGMGTEEPDGRENSTAEKGGPPRKETLVTPALTGSSS